MNLADIKELVLRGPYTGYINLDSGDGIYLPTMGVTIVGHGNGIWTVISVAGRERRYRGAENEEELNEALLEARS